MTEETIRRHATFLHDSLSGLMRDSERIELIASAMRIAIKESSEEKDEVIRRLSLATDSDSEVGSCDCLTKSPDIEHHKKGCKYRLIVERDEARAEAFAAFKANRCI